MSETQNFKNHRQFVPGYHYVLSLLVVATVVGAVINLFGSTGTPGLYSASLILAISIVLVLATFYLRAFALKAQDRAIRAEENLRCFVRTGSLMDSRLTMRQIVALRFASDDEFVELAARAVSENLSEDDIKKAIKSWKADKYRV